MLPSDQRLTELQYGQTPLQQNFMRSCGKPKIANSLPTASKIKRASMSKLTTYCQPNGSSQGMFHILCPWQRMSHTEKDKTSTQKKTRQHHFFLICCQVQDEVFTATWGAKWGAQTHNGSKLWTPQLRVSQSISSAGVHSCFQSTLSG